jgi:fructosamine-3-kinase
MFEAEAEGLAELRAAGAIRVPQVIEVGVADGQSYIDLERLDLISSTAAAEAALGEHLAALHRHTSVQFGWHRANTIGPTPQHNDQSGNWIEFFREHRLRFQLELAAAKGYNGELSELGAGLCAQLDVLFEGYQPVASLLHGDLWGGNWGNVGGEPVIFDPAVYYGDRESDIAMTKLFGGFGPAFYAAYDSSWPMSSGHQQRARLYQLYHVLNHVNLFGAGYRDQAIGLLRELIRIV